MKDPKVKLNKALNKTLNFMMSLDSESSARIPEWYDQMINEITNSELNNKFYIEITRKLNRSLKKDYGMSAANFLMN